MSNLDQYMGSTGTDTVTGFKGIMLAYTVHLTGCDQVYLKPKVDKDGKSVEGIWVDITRVKWDESVPKVVLHEGAKSEPSKAYKPGATEAPARSLT